MSRYLVIGCSGSGKSTLARRISHLCSVPYIDTDSMYWRENWRLSSDAEVVQDLPLNDESWVLDGNFVDFREQVWSRAEHIVWLNYPLPRVLWQVTSRNFGWWLTRKTIWSGNTLPLSKCLSGIRHAFRQYFVKAKTFPSFLAQRQSQRIWIFTSPRECEVWLEELRSKNDS